MDKAGANLYASEQHAREDDERVPLLLGDPRAVLVVVPVEDHLGWDGVGWDGTEWDGTRWDEMGWDGAGMRWDAGMGWGGMGWDAVRWDGMGWDGTE